MTPGFPSVGALVEKAGNPSRTRALQCTDAQRVQLECHYGIKAHKTIYGMVFGT